MISYLSIKDFAIIEDAQIDFDHGLNIITGETGAGKSIVIEAISLALGARADSTFVRSGKEKAVIQFVAELDGEEIIVAREISAAGKSLCKVNGEIVTRTKLAAICEKIADIHGQYDHQSLLSPERHIYFVDAYQSDGISPIKEKLAAEYSEYSQVKSKLASLSDHAEETARQMDFMRFQLDEIQQANLSLGEDAELDDEIRLLQNSERIVQNLSGAYSLSYEESPSALDGLKKALSLLQEISDVSPEIAALTEGFADKYYQLEDFCLDIRRIKEQVSFSQESLDKAISRLDLIDGLKRKYGGSIEKILARADDLQSRLSDVENADEAKATLSAKLAKLETALEKSSKSLSAKRKKSAAQLEQKITAELSELHFSNAALSIQFSETNGYTSTGIDVVEFLIRTNRGEPFKPLAKIASGGEMSRIMLAFKRVIADYDRIPTMIFDEIDSGISGIAASTVGQKLARIASNRQIICITHLPQIAAFGLHHYKIQKTSDDTMTYTTVVKLSEEEKVLEIARLLGGMNITEKTIESARDLIEFSKTAI